MARIRLLDESRNGIDEKDEKGEQDMTVNPQDELEVEIELDFAASRRRAQEAAENFLKLQASEKVILKCLHALQLRKHGPKDLEEAYDALHNLTRALESIAVADLTVWLDDQITPGKLVLDPQGVQEVVEKLLNDLGGAVPPTQRELERYVYARIIYEGHFFDSPNPATKFTRWLKNHPEVGQDNPTGRRLKVDGVAFLKAWQKDKMDESTRLEREEVALEREIEKNN